MLEFFVVLFLFVICAILIVFTISGKARLDARAVQIPSLLTAAELNFFNHIYNTLDSKSFVLCTKVRLGDLIKFKDGDDRQRWKRLQQVNRKHVDFVVCDRKSMMPIFVMELDDSSHNRKDRRNRDILVDSFLRQACLPILHIKCQRSYLPEVRDVMRSLSLGEDPAEDHLLAARASIPF